MYSIQRLRDYSRLVNIRILVNIYIYTSIQSTSTILIQSLFFYIQFQIVFQIRFLVSYLIIYTPINLYLGLVLIIFVDLIRVLLKIASSYIQAIIYYNSYFFQISIIYFFEIKYRINFLSLSTLPLYYRIVYTGYTPRFSINNIYAILNSIFILIYFLRGIFVISKYSFSYSLIYL